MGVSISRKESETLKDYRADQEMEGIQSLDSIHSHALAQHLKIKQNIYLGTMQREAHRGGGGGSSQGNQCLKVDARSNVEENLGEAGYQQGTIGQYDWREDLGWRSQDILSDENQESVRDVNQGQDLKESSVGSQAELGENEDFVLPMQLRNMRPWQVQRQNLLPVQFQKS